jgi:benzodiazapine receptor
VRSRWYRSIEKPDIQPPAQVFPIVWTALYAAIAGASAGVLTRQDEQVEAASVRAFALGQGALPPASRPVVLTPDHVVVPTPAADREAAVRQEKDARRERSGYRHALRRNLLLNAAWTWTFFQGKNPPLATANAAALALSSAGLARRAGRQGRRYGFALSLYAAWCTFATLLSWRIWKLND